MGDDTIDHGIVGEESDDAHFSLAFGTAHGINFIDFPYHLGQATAWDPRALLLNGDEGMLVGLCLPHLAAVSISIESEITDGDLALVRDMRGHPGDELQIIHALHLGGLFPIPVANLALFLLKRKTLQRKERANHIFSHLLGFLLG